MKNFTKLFLAACMITGFAFVLNAQSVGINADGTAPDNSAMLDVKSTAKGFLPPRMIQSLREAIESPAAGLIIWCTDCGASGELQVFNGTTWTNLVGGVASLAQLHIGDTYQGGIIFYFLQPTDLGYEEGVQHGLISATSDQSTGAEWGCYGAFLGVTNTAIGGGSSNTSAIVAGCSTTGIAAYICLHLELNGYTDWYLPTKDEQYQMYLQRAKIGGFANALYWCSSEFNQYGLYSYDFTDGSVQGPAKNSPLYVRAIRAF
jgi:hypothetical protein